MLVVEDHVWNWAIFILNILLKSLNLLHRLMICLEYRILFKDFVFGDHPQQLKKLKHDKINPSKLISADVLGLAHRCEDRLEALLLILVGSDGLVSVFGGVAWAGASHFEVLYDVTNLIDLGSHFGCASKQLWTPFICNIFVNR